MAIYERLNPETGAHFTEDGRVVNLANIAEQFSSSIDTFDQVGVAEYTPIIERSPRPGFSLLRDRVVPEGTTIPLENGELKVDGTSQKVSVYTRKRGRYLPGIIGISGIRFRIEDPSTGKYEYGYGDDFGNRFGLEWDNGEVYTFIESAGDRYYRNPRSQWLDPLDGTGPSGIESDINGLTLRLPFGWYGGLSVEFDVAVPRREEGDRIVTLDRSTTDRLQTGVTIQEPNLPIFAEADGGIGYIGGRQYGVYGRYRPEFRTTSNQNVNKTGIGSSFEPVVSLRVKNSDKFRGVPVIFSGASVISTEKVEWAIFVDADLTGSSFGSISGVPDSETVIEQDTSATSLSNGYRVFSSNIDGGKNKEVGTQSVDIPDFNVPADGTITLAARTLTGTNTDVDAILRVLEEN